MNAETDMTIYASTDLNPCRTGKQLEAGFVGPNGIIIVDPTADPPAIRTVIALHPHPHSIPPTFHCPDCTQEDGCVFQILTIRKYIRLTLNAATESDMQEHPQLRDKLIIIFHY